MNTYDLIIIGGGAGAFAAAIRANELKAKTLMVNAGLPLGGTCVNVGCVPSKTLLWAGEVLHQAQHHGIPGINLVNQGFDFPRVVKDELALVERLRQEKYAKVLENLPSVEFLDGYARFTSPTTIEVNGQIYTGAKFIIATGSTTTVPPIEGLKEAGYLTHSEALRLETQPKQLIVIGAGPVGLEFAQMYARFGTKVTLLQRGPRLFSSVTEPELVDRLAEIFQKEGIEIVINMEVIDVRRDGTKKIVTYRVRGNDEEIAADEILLATGKTPNTQKLDLAKAKVEVDERQAVMVTDHLTTSVPHIYAVGDVTNLPLRLEITAGREGTLAADNALTGGQSKIDYLTVPYTIFTDPQLAGVGWTEAEEMKQLGRCACRTISFADVPKAIIMRRTEGLLKMVIHPQTKQILGVHILGPQAGELVAQAVTLIRNKNTIDDVIESLPMFPTLSEALKIAALSFTKDIRLLSCCI